MRRALILLALLVLTGATEEPRYRIMLKDDGPQRLRYMYSVIWICGMNADSRIFRVVTPSLGSTSVGVIGGHVCAPDETPDLELRSYECSVVSGQYATADDCGYN
jgi:hypothetical protein